MNQNLNLLCLTAALAVLGCSPSASNTSTPVEQPLSGHERMKLELKEIADDTPMFHPYLGSTDVERLSVPVKHAELHGETDKGFRLWESYYKLGKSEVRLGRLQQGIDHLEKAYEISKQINFNADMVVRDNIKSGVNANIKYKNQSRFYLGVAYLRLGETENCCAQNNSESCILPIKGGGLHTKTVGSTQAIRYFTEILEEKANLADANEQLEHKMSAKWLLNIAYMTLNRWPQDVPEKYRVDEDFFIEKEGFPTFKNIMPELALDTFNLCGGAIVDDFDGDHHLDVVTSTWDTQGNMKFFHNNGDGTFEDRTSASQLADFFGGLNMVQADYDNDGDLDIYVLRGAWLQESGEHPNSLLQNNGNGVFTDVTFEAGLGEKRFPSKTAAWADFDNDGDLDLFVGNEATRRKAYASQLFQNNGDGTFTDVAREYGITQPMFAMGCSWGDYDNDRFPDLYVSTGFSNPKFALRDGGPNRLYHNLAGKSFDNVAEELNVTKPIAGFPTWFWDYNNDGNLDIYASCASGPVGVLVSDIRFGLNCLYQGDGTGKFENVAEKMKLDYPSQPMGANFGDINGDGFPDFYLATGNIQYSELRPNIMFLNVQGSQFENVTYSGGFGHLQKGHGVAFADFDSDGDQDVYVQLGGAWPGDKYNDALFKNPGFGNHWITVKLVGTTSNRSAIGARIKIDIIEGDKTRSIYKWVNSGGSFGGNPLQQNIGLGTAEIIKSIEVYWPTSDSTQAFTDVSLDQMILITEGSDEYQEF
ncbi:MAG: CRTAC1 family protein [Pirellulales bacterium]